MRCKKIWMELLLTLQSTSPVICVGVMWELNIWLESQWKLWTKFVGYQLHVPRKHFTVLVILFPRKRYGRYKCIHPNIVSRLSQFNRKVNHFNPHHNQINCPSIQPIQIICPSKVYIYLLSLNQYKSIHVQFALIWKQCLHHNFVCLFVCLTC